MKRPAINFRNYHLFMTLSLCLWLVSACSGAPTEVAQQILPTERALSPEEYVQQQFTATAIAEQQFEVTRTVQALFDQALTGTANYQNTLSAAFAQAQTATLHAEIAPTQTAQSASIATSAARATLIATMQTAEAENRQAQTATRLAQLDQTETQDAIFRSTATIISPGEYNVRFADTDHTLIDLRTPQEFEQERIRGSINIPLEELESRLAEVPKDQDVVVYCRFSNCTRQATYILASHNYTRIYDLGGLLAWRDAGYSLE